MLLVTRILAIASIVATVLPAIAAPIPHPPAERTDPGPSHASHPYPPPAARPPPPQRRNTELKRGEIHTHSNVPQTPLPHVKTNANGNHPLSVHHVPNHNVVMGVAHAHTLNEKSTGHEGGILHTEALDQHLYSIKGGVERHLNGRGNDGRHHIQLVHKPNGFQTQHAHFVGVPHPEGQPAPKIRHFIVGPDTQDGHISKGPRTQQHHRLITEAHAQQPATVHRISPVDGLHGEAAIGTLHLHPNMRDMEGSKGFDHLHAHGQWIKDNLFPGANAEVHVAHVQGTDKVHYFASTRPGGTLGLLTPQLNQDGREELARKLESKAGPVPRSQAQNSNNDKAHQSYSGTFPLDELQLPRSGNTRSHMEVFAKFASDKIAKEHNLTPAQQSELVVSAQHFDGHPHVHYRTQPRGNDLKISGDKANKDFPGIASTAMRNHGPAAGHPDVPWIHSEIAGAMDMAGAAGLKEGDMRDKMPGHVIGIHQSGGGEGAWDRPCPKCHQVLGVHTSADYKGRDTSLKDETQRVVP